MEKDSSPAKPTGSYDLRNSGDGLVPMSEVSRQTMYRHDKYTNLAELRSAVERAGWSRKRSLHLACLLVLKHKNQLTLGGRRRLSALSESLSVEEIQRAQTKSLRLLESWERFSALASWVNRPYRVRSPHRRLERRRIGVGYRDKGTLPPPHRTKELRPGFEYLGPDPAAEFCRLGYPNLQNYVHLLDDVGGGWWDTTRLDRWLAYRRVSYHSRAGGPESLA